MRWAIRLPAILSLAVVCGCGLSLDGGVGSEIVPADGVELSLYMRDLSRQPHSYRILGEHHPDGAGTVKEGPATSGCSVVGRDWELIVSQTDMPIQPGSDIEHRVAGADLGDPRVLSLWLSIDADGRIATGEGVPEWWDADIQRC